MVDYVKLSAAALRLIQTNGRVITLVQENKTPADPTQPWKGPTPGTETTDTISAVFVPPNTVRQFGLTSLGKGTEFIDMMDRSEQIAIVNPEARELTTFSHIEEADKTRWGIIGLQLLKPADVQLLAFIGVRR